MRWCFILILLGISAAALGAKPDRVAIEAFVADYVAKVTRGEQTQIVIDEQFKERLAEDMEEFAECGKYGCRPKFRIPVNPREEIEDDSETEAGLASQAADDDIFEVQIDIEKGGRVLVRRSGCYLVAKRGGKFMMHDYLYECAE